MGQPDTLQDDFFGDFNGARLDHHDGITVAGHDHVEIGGVAALETGVDGVVAAIPGYAARADGPFEGDLADGQRGRGGDHAQGFRRMLFVHRQHGDDHLDLVVQPFGEQRTDAAVGEAGGQYGLGAGAALAPEEAAGDLADGVQPLFKLHSKGQEVDPFAGLVGHYGGGQQNGFSTGDGHGAMGLLGQSTGLQGHGMPADLAVNGEGVHQFLGGVYRCHKAVFSTSSAIVLLPTNSATNQLRADRGRFSSWFCIVNAVPQFNTRRCFTQIWTVQRPNEWTALVALRFCCVTRRVTALPAANAQVWDERPDGIIRPYDPVAVVHVQVWIRQALVPAGSR